MRATAGDDATRLKDPAALRALLLQAWLERDGILAERDGLAAERERAERERDERERAERERAERERDEALAQNERLQALLAKLQRMRFGPRSERLPEDQLRFAFEEIAASIAANEAEAEKKSPRRRAEATEKRRKARGKLPAHLPRVEVVIDPAERACPRRGPARAAAAPWWGSATTARIGST
jgi:transposase